MFDEQLDLERIMQTALSVGEDALTDDEYDLYMQHKPQKAEFDDSHYANLADTLDDSVLSKLAMDVIKWVEWDEDSREDWETRESKGIRLLGVSSQTEGGALFEGASKVTHPLLAEAITQFHSRAIAELWPPEGPVKAVALGDPMPETAEQAERVQDYMNYQYTQLMPGGFEEEDQMLFRLPLSGSCFKKVYFDPLEDAVCSRFVEPADFIAPYSATDLRSSPRFTHRIREMHNDVKRKMAYGYYIKTDLAMPLNEGHDYPRTLDEIDHTEGKSRTQVDEDERHTILEMYVDYDLPGHEDDYALPYIVTVDRDEQKVLRVQRNWKPDDERKRKRIYFAHYKFTPGFGFYGYGLLHLIGGLSNSATGALRALLDSAQYSNLQGGFRTRDSKIIGGDTPIAPGEWREVQSSMEELKNGFFPLPTKEPSKVLFELLGYLDERGQRFASTTENMVGEATNTAPVGTTMALIEQGSKVFTAIHKRLHEAHAKEFRIVAELNYEYLPEEGYPYAVKGGNRSIMASDFDDRVDVIPVSDPALISNTQRIAQAQALLDMSERHADKINVEKAVRNMLAALRVNPDEYMIEQQPGGSIDDQLAMIDAELKRAEIDKTKAETILKNIEAIYSSIQAGQAAASMPPILPISDELLLSAGYEDKNGPPIAQPPGEAAQLPTRYSEQVRINQEIPTNTDPRFPANPESAVEGVRQGIETIENDI